MRGVVSVLVLAVLGCGPVDAGDTPVRVLLYGDSLTQGSSGDYTWRYRLWRHFEESDRPLNLVGPRDDLQNFRTFAFGDHEYAEPGFDTDHAAISGGLLTQPRYELPALADEYTPDVVVALMGINDLALELATPEQLVERWRRQIAAMRQVKPDVAVVLVQVPHATRPGVAEYNQGMMALAAELDSRGSRVRTTALAPLELDTDTYDTVHLTAAGEVKIAAVVADELAELGYGAPYPDTWEPVDPGPRWAPDPELSLNGSTLTVTWPVVDYANLIRVEVKDETADQEGSMDVPTATATWSAPVVPGHEYIVRLRAVKGTLASATASEARSVTVPDDQG